MELAGQQGVSVPDGGDIKFGSLKPKHLVNFTKGHTGESHLKELGAVPDREGFRDAWKADSSDRRAIRLTVPKENRSRKRTLRPTETIRPNETKRR